MTLRRYTDRELHYLRRALMLRRNLTDKALSARLNRSPKSVMKAMQRIRREG